MLRWSMEKLGSVVLYNGNKKQNCKKQSKWNGFILILSKKDFSLSLLLNLTINLNHPKSSGKTSI